MRRLLPLFLSLCLLTPAASASSPEPSTPTAQLQALRAAADTGGSVKVIVGLRLPTVPEGRLSAAERSSQRSRIAAASTSFQARHAGPIAKRPNAFRSFEAIPYVAMEVTPQELAALAADPAVESISPNRVNRPMLAESTALIRAPQAWTMGFTGAGQAVAVIDTGVDKTHPFLAGKVTGEACFSLGGWCPGGRTSATGAGAGMPCPGECDHGTHVAGIAAGKGSSFSGVAKDGKVAAIQVFSPSADGPVAYDSDILAGLQWVQDNAAALNIVAVNMSLGGGKSTKNCDRLSPAMTAMINSLASKKIATVIASGNDGFRNAISFPACISTAVSVGSTWDSNGWTCRGLTMETDKVACYSNSARILTLLAPGSVINSSIPVGEYEAHDGTSMATPHVAGAWAVLRSAVPDAGVSEILAAFKTSGKPVTDYRNGIVTPRIDVAAAVNALRNPDISFTVIGKSAGKIVMTGGGKTEVCTQSCARSFPRGATVQITAEGVIGTVFRRWRAGSCTTPSCSVSMFGPVAIAAEFGPAPRYALSYVKAGKGVGSVSVSANGSATTCAKSCKTRHFSGLQVTLTASPAGGSSFSGWSGACAGTAGTACTVTMDAAKSVTATFSVSAPAGAQLSAR